MNQVLMNLCLNSRDAMPDGGRLLIKTANVVVKEEDARAHPEAYPGELVRMRVEDTGHGIPAAILPRVFDPFFTTKGPNKGTGLGLAMIYSIVKQHRGWIECHSQVGKGTRFDLYLPRGKKEIAQASPSPMKDLAATGSGSILLVDDEEMIRNIGRVILERCGYRVTLAKDGVDALKIFSQVEGRFDLILLDMRMPQLSGHDTYKRLRATGRDVRVMFCSGFSEETWNEEDGDGIIGFLSKPFRPEELTVAVRNALDKRPVSVA
jgi:two-component system cell cycle sensor histidine kinase/response regulator CckA